jgi:peptidoglycan hydrolase-like protein with peptidoglycan-binding domain
VEQWFQNTRGLVIIVLAVITAAILLATEPGDGFPTGAVSTSDDTAAVTTTITTLPQATTTTVGKPTLQEGTPDTSNTMALQQRLIQLGYSVTADGSFGPGTKTAVQQFQTSQGLNPSGIVDQATWNALANPKSTAASSTTTTTKP